MPCVPFPWEMLYLALFLQTSQLHRKFQSGAKDGQEYKTLTAVLEQIGKKNRILTKCFIWKDINLPPVFPGLADIMGSALLVWVIYRTPIGRFSSEKAITLICFHLNSVLPKGILCALPVQIKIWQLGIIQSFIFNCILLIWISLNKILFYQNRYCFIHWYRFQQN